MSLREQEDITYLLFKLQAFCVLRSLFFCDFYKKKDRRATILREQAPGGGKRFPMSIIKPTQPCVKGAGLRASELPDELREIVRALRRGGCEYYGTASTLAAEIGGEWHPLVLGRMLTALHRAYPRQVYKKRVHNCAYYRIRFLRGKRRPKK